METAMIVLILLGAAVLIGYGIVAWRRKKRQEEAAEAQQAVSAAWDKTAAVEPRPSSVGPYIHTRQPRSWQGSGTAAAPSQPTVVQHDSGMNPLLYGALGYMIGSSGNSHAHHEPSTANIGTCPAERDSDIGGGSSNYDSGSSSDSGSSDSGSSSYDSGSSSSDSGSSSGGGSD